MTKDQAKKTGSRQAIKAVVLGLLIAQLIMTAMYANGGLLDRLLWFVDFDYNLNIIAGILIMLLSGYFFGQRAGVDILIKKRNDRLTGFKYGLATLLTTAFLASLVGFFQEGLSNVGTNDEPVYDYIFKPVFWVLVFGLIPVILVGLWFGRQIKKRSDE